MKTKVGFLMYLWVTSMIIQANDAIFIQANDAIPQGTWEVVQVTIEINTDGNVQKRAYANATGITHIQCPQEWEIKDALRIQLRGAYEYEKDCRYVIEDNRLIISIDDNTTRAYQYELNGAELILTTEYEQPGKNEDHQVEHWTITLKQQVDNIKN